MENKKKIFAAICSGAATLALCAASCFLPSLFRREAGELEYRAAIGRNDAGRIAVNYDVSGNGTVNIKDVSDVLDALAVGNAGAKYDLDLDGTVSIGDVSAILDYLSSPDEYDGVYGKREDGSYCSPSSVAVCGEKIYVTDATGEALYRFSADGTREARVDLGGTASKVRAENGRIYVLYGEKNGKLGVYSPELEELLTVSVGHTPTDLYIDGTRAFVANRFSSTVSVVNLEEGRVTASVDAGREPCCMAAAGGKLYVGCRLQGGSALEASVGASVLKIDMATQSAEGTIVLQDGVNNLRSMAVSPDGSALFITHTVARYTYPTTQLDRGWVNSNGFTRIDLATGRPSAFLLDDLEYGAANPYGAAFSKDGKSLYFTLAGTGELITLDMDAFGSRIASLSSLDGAIDRLDLLAGCKTRVKLGGDGIREICENDGRLYVCRYFTGDVAVCDPASGEILLSLVPENQPSERPARRGERLWNDATFCYQSWESCSSCHPDARSDALNWDEGGDGWGTPKNTKSMIFSMRTPPVLATGLVASAEDNVMGTVREAFHSALDEENVECINEYLRSLLPAQSPYLDENGKYTPEALRGKELFELAGCAVCHPAPLYTDLKTHRSPFLGTDGTTEDRPFVTPTLVELWRSAPYTFCGGETDLKEIIRAFSRVPLDDGETADLERFLLSIGTVGEYYGIAEVFAEKDGAKVYGGILPGERITGFSIVKQIPTASGVSAPTVTVTLTAPDGRVLFRRVVRPGAMAYGDPTHVSMLINVPENLPVGSKLSFEITSDKGGSIATVASLSYNG